MRYDGLHFSRRYYNNDCSFNNFTESLVISPCVVKVDSHCRTREGMRGGWESSYGRDWVELEAAVPTGHHDHRWYCQVCEWDILSYAHVFYWIMWKPILWLSNGETIDVLVTSLKKTSCVKGVKHWGIKLLTQIVRIEGIDIEQKLFSLTLVCSWNVRSSDVQIGRRCYWRLNTLKTWKWLGIKVFNRQTY